MSPAPRARRRSKAPVLSEAMADVLRQDQEERLGTGIDFMTWALRAPEPKSGVLDFDRFPFQRELYSAGVNDKEAVIMKSTQVGVSAFGVRWALYHADVRGMTGLYVFPTARDVWDFSTARINPVIDASPYLRSRQHPADPNNKGMKGIGRGLVYFRGSESKRGLDSVDADHIVFDEYDTLCFPAGTMVLTRAGHVPIEQVRIGDEVLTHRGRWRAVTATGSRRADHLVSIRGQGVEVEATAEHPFYTRRRINKEVVRGVPRVARMKNERPCSVAECEMVGVAGNGLCSAHYQRQRKHGSVLGHIPVRTTYHRHGKPTPYRVGLKEAEWVEAGSLIPAEHYVAQVLPPVELDDRSEEWWWFVGRYLADGCRDNNSVHIACAENEAQALEARVSALFGNARYHPDPRARAGRVTICSRSLVAELDEFGRYSHGKRFTAHALALETSKARALLSGYLGGDGSAFRSGWKVDTVSRALALGVCMLAQRVFGVVPSCYVAAEPGAIKMPASAGGKTVNRKKAWRVAFGKANNGPIVDGEMGWKRIRSATTRAGKFEVFNLSVDEDESYVAENCVVHNCQPNIPDAERRITGSKHGLIRRVGVPSVPDYGIAGLYAASDQRVWRVKCDCGKWQSIDFERNVDLETGKRLCLDPDCRKELDVGNGEWVATYPDRDVRGYHVTRLIAPTASMATIIAASRKRAQYERQVFYNKDLGLPYAPAEGRLSREALAAAQSAGNHMMEPGYHGGNLVTMGVDVASARDLNVRISEHLSETKKRALWIGTVDSFDHLGLLMHRYQVNMAAIDHLPDGRLSRAFCEKYPGRAYLVSYDGTQNPTDSRVFKVDDEMRHIRVRRTEAIDAMTEMIRAQNNLLPANLPDGYIEQMQALVRHTEEDELGRRTVSYRRMGAADDYAHAEVYDVVATEAWYFRQGMAEAQRQVYQPLENMMEFERSHLADYEESGEYYAGGADDDYYGDENY